MSPQDLTRMQGEMHKLNDALAEFARVWDGVLWGDPEYAAIGDVSSEHGCVHRGLHAGTMSY